jgi:hypothetical protein
MRRAIKNQGCAWLRIAETAVRNCQRLTRYRVLYASAGAGACSAHFRRGKIGSTPAVPPKELSQVTSAGTPELCAATGPPPAKSNTQQEQNDNILLHYLVAGTPTLWQDSTQPAGVAMDPSVSGTHATPRSCFASCDGPTFSISRPSSLPAAAVLLPGSFLARAR